MQRATSDRWLVPGQKVGDSDGWVVELPGLAVRLTDSSTTSFVRGETHMLTAEVQLMCGCPITPGGLWDSAGYDITAEVWQGGKLQEVVTLPFSAAPGRFAANWTPKRTGKVYLTIIARNRTTGNTGVLTEIIKVK